MLRAPNMDNVEAGIILSRMHVRLSMHSVFVNRKKTLTETERKMWHLKILEEQNAIEIAYKSITGKDLRRA